MGNGVGDTEFVEPVMDGRDSLGPDRDGAVSDKGSRKHSVPDGAVDRASRAGQDVLIDRRQSF